MRNLEIIESRLVDVRNKKVLLDKDVAEFYGIETKRVNEAVKNNPEKFPPGYVIYLDEEETEFLRSKFSTLEINGRGKYSKYQVKAFTDKGLYMLATILKSPKATETTIAIIETYSKLKQFSKAIQSISGQQNENSKQNLMKKGNELLAEILEEEMPIDETETSIEFNFALLKLKHTVKRKK